VIQFPETASSEWKTVADLSRIKVDLRKKIERGTEVEKEVERRRVRHEADLLFQQELDADSTPALEMMTLADYKNNPSLAPVDLIDGVLKDKGLCIMLGPSGSGKSTTALQMIQALLSGDDFLGQTAKPLSGAAGIVSYDMDASLMMDWMSGFPNIDQRKVSVINAHKRGNPLGVPAHRQQIIDHWKAMNVEIVMIDSFSASFFGHDQNDAAATMAHYRELQKFALTEVGARAVIVIVHSGKGSPDTARGSSVHHDVADSIVGQEGTNNDPRKVQMIKYRAALGQQQMLPVIVTAPDAVTHLVKIDTGAMSMEGMRLPDSVVAEAFADMPEAINEPEYETGDPEDFFDNEEGEDL
jgi:archaellum biogenesis ATPase FlaH